MRQGHEPWQMQLEHVNASRPYLPCSSLSGEPNQITAAFCASRLLPVNTVPNTIMPAAQFPKMADLRVQALIYSASALIHQWWAQMKSMYARTQWTRVRV